ncbi:MAG TPA: Rieske 2Fe-2S domain-containing protein [Actinocrinis sp.]|uniref:Rieske (2Fe-2S) protein n=1 Tax=Actinocrinis sp. TaxID=1920516 RepID=UPI002DDD67BF|nr:Rieske 2Fe-2S domain-containing protein [Actinocrinis sp.]HEV2347633.1 Rieske 2Fe-2S domain-containing protein [Actinocrinis sp.]
MTAGQERQAQVRRLDGDVIAVELADRTVLISGICPHRKGLLRYGTVDVEKQRITCPLHHSAFSLETGERVAGPACEPLRVYDELPQQRGSHEESEAPEGLQHEGRSS